MNHRRFKYAIAMVGVIAAGLWWRSAANPLSPFLHKYGGDALWALLIFLGIRCALIQAALAQITLLALAFCFAVEFSQLYHAPWIDAIRATRLGALALGATFNAPDLLAYILGIACGTGLEMAAWRGGSPKSNG
ncbi:MAG: DUF2809 domain-containing protein [Verrucomicrobiota bacterium]